MRANSYRTLFLTGLFLAGALPSLACGGSNFSTSSASGGSGSTATASGGTEGQQGNVSKEGLVYWFRADQGVEDDSGVASWLDVSGNGVHAVQPQLANRPKVQHPVEGGLPMLEFDGEDDELDLPELTVDFTNGLSFFAVASASTEVNCAALLELSNGAEIDDISFDRNSQSLAYEVAETYTTGEAGLFPMNGVTMLGVVQPAGEVSSLAELRINGALTSTADLGLPATTTRTQNFIGRTLYAACNLFAGSIGELLLFNRAISPAERRVVESYLRNRWKCCG